MSTRSKHKKHKLSKVWLWLLGILVAIVVVVFVSQLSFVKDRLAQTTGNVAVYQKQEYEKQRAIAKKKYGQQATSFSETSQKSPKKTKTKYTYYTVQLGDYLSTIAQDYGLTVEEIMELNKLDSKVVSVGQKLKLPKNTTQTNSNASANSDNDNYYGDSSNDTDTSDTTGDAY